MKIENVIKNDTPFLRISSEEYHYSFGYYSRNMWVDEENIVLTRSKNITSFKNCELILLNIRTGAEIILAQRCADYSEYVVYGESVYYIADDKLFFLNLRNMENNILIECPDMGFPHMTNDGRYINMQRYKTGSECYLYDLNTHKLTKEFEKNFEKPFPIANHMMICPTDPEKIFFSHEGITFYISNRLWLYEKNKGMRCIAKQNLDEQGDLGDCFGHECWAPDGEGLYFVKYSCSPTPPRGISYVDLKGNQRNAIYSKYPYWHVAASPNGKYLAADTQSGKTSNVCLVNLETHEEKLLVETQTNWKHPCHPHPAFSPKSEKLCFHELAGGQIAIGIITI